MTVVPVDTQVGEFRIYAESTECRDMKATIHPRWLQAMVCGLGLAACVGFTGCQMSIGGQTLPSAYYIEDDVQYYPPATEFKLSKEAAAMKAYKAEQELQKAMRPAP
jgi:hypothetical protein